MSKKGNKLISGALILGGGAFIAKVLGAIYRIPLTKIIGGTGLGLYQMVFPVYALLLDLSGAGVPNAMAKLIAAERVDREVYARKILKVSLIFFAAVGAMLSLLTALFAGAFSAAQGNGNARLAYIALAPSVFLVCLICCFRGYFQGFMDMTHTAASQIIEQTVKLGAGLVIAKIFLPDIPKAVAGAALAITISEFVALIVLVITYIVKNKRNAADIGLIKLERYEFGITLKKIVAYSIPIALTGMILPLSKVIDSFFIVNFLSVHTENATGVYGVFSGVAITVIGLPVAVCYGISAVVVPLLSGAEEKSKRKNAAGAVFLTLAFSVPCAFFCAFAAPFIIKLLFGYMSAGERGLAINLLRVLSPCVVLLSLLQTLNGILIGKDSPKKPLIGMAAGVMVKTLIEIFTLKNPKIGIYGAAAGAIACYLVADLVNLILVFPLKSKKRIKEKNAGSGIKIGVRAHL